MVYVTFIGIVCFYAVFFCDVYFFFIDCVYYISLPFFVNFSLDSIVIVFVSCQFALVLF